MNKVIIIGRLTADPEFRQTQSNVAVCGFTVAVNRKYKNEKGEYDADFINCKAWKQTAEFVSRYFTKGSQILVEGSLRTGKYKDKHDVTHYTTDINVENVEFVGTKQEKPAEKLVAQAQTAEIPTGFEELINDEEMPF